MTADDAGRRSPDAVGSGLVILGVGYQWLYNGVNFFAFKIGGEAFHPLMLAALRFGIAALLIPSRYGAGVGSQRPCVNSPTLRYWAR